MKRMIYVAAMAAFLVSLESCRSKTEAQAKAFPHSTGRSVSSTQENTGRKKETPGDILEPTAGKRTIENGTKVTLKIGDVEIPATLNNSRSAQDLLSRLPYTIPLYDYTDDYCATMQEPLEYDEADRHRGWMTGDIDFVLPARWFVLLFNQNGLETTSTWHINVGTIDGDLSVFKDLPERIDVLIERAE